MSAPQKITGDVESINQFLENFDTFLFDCDGVLWSGEKVFPGVIETLHLLRDKGKKLVFVTNNSRRSRSDYKKKLEGLGISADIEDIFGSAYSASIYISRIMNPPPSRRKVFVIGESGIEQELAAENLTAVGGTDPAFRRDTVPEDFEKLAKGDESALDPEVSVVLVGLDMKYNYLKMATAYHHIRRGAKFLATNIDSTFPAAGTFFPGAGSLCAPLIGMLNGQEPLALGKPSQAMMDAIEGKFKLDRKRTCMVGDRINTDIRFGIDGGLGGTLGVLTGVSSEEDMLKTSYKPMFYTDKLSDLLIVKS